MPSLRVVDFLASIMKRVHDDALAPSVSLPRDVLHRILGYHVERAYILVSREWYWAVRTLPSVRWRLCPPPRPPPRDCRPRCGVIKRPRRDYNLQLPPWLDWDVDQSDDSDDNNESTTLCVLQ